MPRLQYHMRRPVDGRVRYIHKTRLYEPLELPPSAVPLLALVVAGAIIIGLIFGTRTIDNIINSETRSKALLEQAVNSGATLEIPNIVSLSTMDDASIVSTLNGTGKSYVDMMALGKSDTSGEITVDYVKLPDGTNVATAQQIYTNGMGSLAPVDAVSLLNGSWRMTVSRDQTSDIRVKYADFKSGTITSAIDSAMASQGWENTVLGEGGVDTSGNTYQTGTMTMNDITYDWTVSACELSAVYNIKGLPDNSFYVGMRLTERLPEE